MCLLITFALANTAKGETGYNLPTRIWEELNAFNCNKRSGHTTRPSALNCARGMDDGQSTAIRLIYIPPPDTPDHHFQNIKSEIPLNSPETSAKTSLGENQ